MIRTDAESPKGAERCETDDSKGVSATQDRDAGRAGASDAETSAMDPVQMFRSRWSNADDRSRPGKELAVCGDISDMYEPVGLAGWGRYGRIFVAEHKADRRKVALKLYSFRRLSRKSGSLHETALEDGKCESPEFCAASVQKRVLNARLEMLLVRSMSGLSPFVLGMAEVEGESAPSVCDLRKGELGYVTEVMVGNIGTVWLEWERAVDKSQQSDEDFKKMMVFTAAQGAEALRYLYRCGVVHHDISLGNILVGPDGYVKLADFGRAFVVVPAWLPVPRVNITNPLSVQSANLTNQATRGFAGPPEDVWVACHGTFMDKKRIGSHGDLHMFGYTLLCLDRPLSFKNSNYLDINFDKSERNFTKFAEKYKIERTLKTIDGSLANFISELTESLPEHRLGYYAGEELLCHPAFKDIDFDLLRKKQLPAPMDDALRKILKSGPRTAPVDRMSSPWGVDSQEERYCQKLSEAQRKDFSDSYLHM